nr:hypothetical protein [Luteibacter rhizovicinus]
MGLKAVLHHPLVVGVLGSVGSAAVIAGATALREWKPFTETLFRPITLPLWAVAGGFGMAAVLLVAMLLKSRKGTAPPTHDKRYKPSSEATTIVAALRAADRPVDDDELIAKLAPHMPAHVGKQDLKLAFEQLSEAGWLKLESIPSGFGFGFGYTLAPPGLEFCRTHELTPYK